MREGLPPGHGGPRQAHYVLYAWYCPRCRARLAGRRKSDVLAQKKEHMAGHRRVSRARVTWALKKLRARLGRHC